MKRETLALVFSWEFCKIFKTTFFNSGGCFWKGSWQCYTNYTIKDYNIWCKNRMSFFKITKTQRRHKIEKIKSNWRNYLICSPDCGGVQNTPETKNTLIFLSAITVMQVIFWTGDHFCFIPDCGNSFNCKPKKILQTSRLFLIFLAFTLVFFLELKGE